MRVYRGSTLIWRCLVILLLAGLSSATLAGVLTPATGGEAIPATNAGGAFTELSGPVYEETSAREVGAGTIILRLPPGFQWDTQAPLPRIRVNKLNGGNDNQNINNLPDNGFITANAVTAQEVRFTINSTTIGQSRARLTFERLRVRPSAATPGVSGNIVHQGTSSIDGVTTGVTSWGFLRQVANVALFANDQTPGPVEVNTGEPVELRAVTFNCPGGNRRWRAVWRIDGEIVEVTDERVTSACAAPFLRTEVFNEVGAVAASVTIETRTCELTGPFTGTCYFAGPWTEHGRDEIALNVVGLDVNALYRFFLDESEWNNVAGEVADNSGNGRDGTAIGANTSDNTPARPGNPGTCGYGVFDAGDRIVAPGSAQVNNANSFSVAAWVRLQDAAQTGGTPSLIAYGDTDGVLAERFELYLDLNATPAEYVWGIQTENGDVALLRTPAGTGGSADPLVGEWVHLAASYNAQTSEGVMYVNGAEINRGPLQDFPPGQGPALPQDAAGDLGLMAHPGGAFPTVGDMDEPGIFAGVFSPEDVQSLFQEIRDCTIEVATFRITLPETGSVCSPLPVTVEAIDALGERLTGYTGTIQLSTSANRGNWSLAEAAGSLSPDPHQADDGAARYEFVPEDQGVAGLRLANQAADQLTVGVEDIATGESVTSDPVQFLENAFVINEQDPLEQDFVAGRDHGLQLRAERRDENGNCGLVTAYDGDIGVKAWISRGAQDPGGEPPVLAGVAGAQTMANAQPGGNNITIAFDQGVADLAWQTTDVGQYQLNIREDSSGLVVDAQGEPLPVLGAGAPWVVRPFAVHVTVADNPGAQAPAGDAFIAAGRPFPVSLRGVLWSSAADSNGDGQPDNHDGESPGSRVSLAANGTVPSFNLPAESVTLSSRLAAGPVAAADPSLRLPEPVSAFSAGAASALAAYDEVGSIGLLARFNGTYLDRVIQLRGDSGFVGRFHPEQFRVTATDGRFAPVCGDFVYSGQEHGYELAPELVISPLGFGENGSGPVLSNYRDGWQRLTRDGISRLYPAQDGNTELPLTVMAEPAQLEPLGDGRMDYLFGDDRYTYTKNQAARRDPFLSALTVTIDEISDGDAVLDPDQAPVSLNPEGVNIRYGRIRLNNVFGPEGVVLEMPLQAEFLQDGRFVVNNEDSAASAQSTEDCFTFRPADLDEVSLEPQGVAVNVSPDGENPLFMGQSEPGNGILLESANNPAIAGNNRVTVTLVVPPWLQDFQGEDELVDPAATATFGVYRGHDRIIYWRELGN